MTRKKDNPSLSASSRSKRSKIGNEGYKAESSIGLEERFYSPFEDHLKNQDNSDDSSVYSNQDHPLLENGYCQEWITKDGQRRCIYGKVVEVLDDGEDDASGSSRSLQVEYSESSRLFLNQHYPVFPKHTNLNLIPKRQVITEEMAWGGCSLYDLKCSMKKNWKKKKVSFHWRVPDLYIQSQHGNKADERLFLPRLILHYASFQLTFTVKPSTIPNAGYGVFLAASSLLRGKQQQYFTLEPGELLDMGVYAPHTAQDQKDDLVMMVSSFIHEFEPESYSFDAPPTDNSDTSTSVYDISTFQNGTIRLSAIAQLHIPPYVNEQIRISVDELLQPPEVHAHYDPQGSLHYLLGNPLEHFRLKADGKEREIFVNYGERYEMVRIRQGYSSSKTSNKEAILEQDEIEYLQNINNNVCSDAIQMTQLQSCVTAVQEIVNQVIRSASSSDQENQTQRLKRSLIIIVIFYAGIQRMQKQQTNKKEDHDWTQLKSTCCTIIQTLRDSLMAAPTNMHVQHLVSHDKFLATAFSMAFPDEEQSDWEHMSDSDFWNLMLQ